MIGRIEGFDHLLNEGFAELRLRLKDRIRERRVSREQAADLLPLIRDLNFPALMMFLAKGTGTKDSGKSKKLSTFDIGDSKAIRAALKRVPLPAGLKPKDAQQVIDLLLTGQFFGDVADATAATLHLIPNLPISVVRDVRSLPRLPIRLVIAIKRDLITVPSRVRLVKQDLLDNGKLDRQPVILNNTVKVIFQQAAPFQIAQTLQTLLDNETVRLAIIIFARSEGIQISQKELDAVQEALDPNDPDLGALVVPAFERFRKDIGLSNVLKMLERLVL
ncbi:MAG: hypothetical protein NPIRA04_21960 [Nitrospirales bacterium]|nr:MAG: hypothetical protein NPIRA04_21960 [Nitrospirales bacterium]